MVNLNAQEIALDLCQPHYQILLITYLKFTEKNSKIKTVNHDAILLGLKILNYTTNVKKRWLKTVNVLIKTFPSVYQFCNGGINKFVLLLRKGVYPYEYKDSWERFDETSLPDREAFRSELNPEDITDEDYAHGQKVWEVFEIKNLGEYHDLYVHSDTLLLADVCLKNLETNVLKYMNLILRIFCLHQHGKLV